MTDTVKQGPSCSKDSIGSEKPGSSQDEEERPKLEAEFTYALHLWPSAPILAQFVWFNRAEFAGNTVIELGSGGTAVPGIAAYKAGSKVIFTDKSDHETALALCRQNCIRNGIVTPDIRGLDWGIRDENLENLPKIDYILAADCFFDPSVFEILVTTISWILERNSDGKCYFTYQIRDSEWSIEWLLQKYKLNCRKIPLHSFHADCTKVPGFDEELRRHTIEMGIIERM